MCASSETARRLCLTAIVGAVVAGSSHAGPITVDPQGNPLPPRLVATTSAGAARSPSIPEQLRSVHSVEGHQLRCWQHGKLIIDEFRPGPASAAPSFTPATADMPLAVQAGTPGRAAVLDGRNTTCLLKPQSRAMAAAAAASVQPPAPATPHPAP
jgi:hypothetical protein